MVSPSISCVGSLTQSSVGMSDSVAVPSPPASASSSSSREVHAALSSVSVNSDAATRVLRLLNMVALLGMAVVRWETGRPSRRRAPTEGGEQPADAADQALGKHEHDEDERGTEQRPGQDLLALDEVLRVAAQHDEDEGTHGRAEDGGGAADRHGHEELDRPLEVEDGAGAVGEPVDHDGQRPGDAGVGRG